MKFNYHIRLFLLLVAFSLAIVASVVGFQYAREKEYKAELLNSRLQAFNREFVADSLGRDLAERMRHFGFSDLRVTVIDTGGNLLYDNMMSDSEMAHGMNHLDRPEVARALRSGEGYTVRRHSESTDSEYFYSATREGDFVVRSAVPYTVSLSHVLDADRGFLWFMASITLAAMVLAWFATRRISHTVARLNSFASRAEAGDEIYDDEAFPSDELGEISRHIVRLYVQRERTHEEALRQEREKIRIKKQLTNNINHELKTPVAAMRVCLETLMEHPDLPEEKRDLFLRRCHLNCERLLGLLADVSALTRLDDGRDSIAVEDVDLAETVSEALGSFVLPSGMALSVDVPEKIVMRGNARFLSAVFANLMSNAIAYSRASEVSVSAIEGPDGVTVTFADNGVGVAPEHLPRLFERFYRIEQGRSRSSGGTGLGLAIVRNAVTFHGGTIVAEGAEGGGLRFVMRFPSESAHKFH